jgi:hypothetical protein
VSEEYGLNIISSVALLITTNRIEEEHTCFWLSKTNYQNGGDHRHTCKHTNRKSRDDWFAY